MRAAKDSGILSCHCVACGVSRYVDENLRISRGNKGSMYVQKRERNPPEWI